MKREANLFEKIIDLDNIEKAILKSSKGKRSRKEVIRVLDNIDYYTYCIHYMLKEKSYVPSEYKVSFIYCNKTKKTREIFKPKYYPDQVIQYCLMNVLEPILMRKFYLYSCGSIPGRGTSFAKKNLEKWLRKDIYNTKYCLKMDIRKFYPNIDKEIMKSKFKKIIKDKDTLELINLIIDSSESGIPIGNYTSAWFSNFYLQDLDTYIKEELKIKYYVRYVDDLVLLGSNKRKLYKDVDKIKNFLVTDKLSIKDNYRIFLIDDNDIDFLGFRFFRDKTILRKRNMLRISRRAKKIGKKDNVSFQDACSMVSYYGWIKHSNSYNFYNTHVKPFAPLCEMKKVISYHMKFNNKL